MNRRSYTVRGPNVSRSKRQAFADRTIIEPAAILPIAAAIIVAPIVPITVAAAIIAAIVVGALIRAIVLRQRRGSSTGQRRRGKSGENKAVHGDLLLPPNAAAAGK